jgi:hypothetical protein
VNRRIARKRLARRLDSFAFWADLDAELRRLLRTTSVYRRRSAMRTAYRTRTRSRR